MNYTVAKAAYVAIEAQCEAASAALKAIPGVGSGPMGLTPDAVKATPAYKSAKANFDASFATQRKFNAKFVKQFAKEIRTERRARALMREASKP